MLRYFDEWAFRHPNDNDFIRVMEKESGLELDWYREYFVQTTKTINYSIAEVSKKEKKTTKIKLQKEGLMPMPLDIEIKEKNGDKTYITIPLQMMRGSKKGENGMTYETYPDWPWTNEFYELEVPIKSKNVESIIIDPSGRLADTDKERNTMEGKKGKFKN